MRRLLKHLLSLGNLKKALGFSVFFAGTKYNFHIEEVREFKAKNVLVLAPHPDDDAFGLGGTISKATKGGKVIVAYFCDGSGGVPEGKGKLNKKLVEIRKKEAEEAAKILKISEQVFFNYPDGKLAAGYSSVKALRQLLERVKPDIIFVPSFLDNHPDHRVVNEILLSSLAQTSFSSSEIWAYEIWSPIFINRVVDITKEIETKKKAMVAHKSQLESRNYDKAILGLNQYRAEINNNSGFAEGFFASTPEIYKELYKKS